MTEMPGAKKVTLIKNEGKPNEQRLNVRASVQDKKGFFPVDFPIYEGDIVETSDPRGGIRRLSVAHVAVRDAGPRNLHHLEVTWGNAPSIRTAAIQRIGLTGLHPSVLEAAGGLFTDGHFADSILAAFRAIEVRVKRMSGIDATGQDLMAKVFDERDPKINLAVENGRSGESEQIGFKFMFMGAMTGIRNPKAHEIVVQDDPQRTLEYLAFSSLLMRRLDDAE